MTAPCLIIAWKAVPRPGAVDKNPPRFRPDGRFKDPLASIEKKHEAFKEEVQNSYGVPYFSMIDGLIIRDMNSIVPDLHYVGGHLVGGIRAMFENAQSCFPEILRQPFDANTDAECYGIGIKQGLKILASHLFEEGDSLVRDFLPLRFWKSNSFAFDPFDGLMSESYAESKTNVTDRIMDAWGLSKYLPWSPHVDLEKDIEITKAAARLQGMI